MNRTILKGESWMLIGILVFMAIIMVYSLLMPDMESKILPLVFAALVFILTASKLWRDLSRSETKAGGEAKEGEGEEKKEKWRGYLVHGGWAGGFLLGIVLLGFLIAIPFFVLFYMKRLGAKWRTALIFAVATILFIWGVFELALNLELYRGLLYEWLVPA